MASTVVGLYDRHEIAERAFRALDEGDFDRDDIHMVSHESTDTDGWNASARNWNEGAYGHDLADRLSDLNVPEDEAMLYAEAVRRGGSLIVVRVDDDKAGKAAALLNKHEPVDIETRRKTWTTQGFKKYDPKAKPFTAEEVGREHEHIGKEERVPVVEEEMKVGKREVNRGGVRIHSHTTSRPVEEKVSLRDEHVDVERRAANRPVTDADRAFQDRTIEMKETDEEAVVDKQARVTGEVVARKGSEERTETVRDTLRKTEVEVEQTGGAASAKGGRFESFADGFRSHCSTNYGNAWKDYEPAYRWGFDTSRSEPYRNREFSVAETDLRRDYEKRHGKGGFDRMKDAIKMAYDRGRRA